MHDKDLQTLVAIRLEHMADRVDFLRTRGKQEEADLLRREGLELARCYDEGYDFFYATDYKNIQ